jgi:alpha-tubulin suppressor-like RCC1 family protein
VGVAQGYSHSMALDSKGQLWGAGYNLNGSLGLGNNTDPISSWTANTSIGITRVVACGNDFTMRITPTGLLETTGGANNYKNGTGTGTPTNYFTSANTGVLVGYTVKNVWASDLCTFALRSDDKLCVAGYNVSGETGSSLSPTQSNQYFVLCTDTNFSAESPVELSSVREFGFGAHTMMITASGKIYGAGDGANYRTGLNSTTDVNIFTQCTGGIDSVTVTQVATTEQASIAMDSTGNVWITGLSVVNGLSGTAGNSDSQQFVKITEPAEFYSKTIVNVMGGYDNTFYALDSEGTMWGVGQYIRGLGQGSDGYKSKLFNKLPIYDIVPKEFKYTPTLSLENPNPDHGATVEFKNPNNKAVINLDDKTSSLRLGFVNNKNNAGQFKGLQIAADGSLFGGIGIGTTNFFNRNFIVDGPNPSLEVSATNENQSSTIYLGTPFRYRVDPYPSPPKAAIVAEGISNYSRSKLHFCVEDTASNDAQYIAGVDNARMTIIPLGHVGIGTTNPVVQLHQHANFAAYHRFTNNYSKTWTTGLDGNAYIIYAGSTGVYLAYGGTSWNANSDERVKKNITEMTNCLDNISNIRPVYYNYKFDEEKQPRRIGFIAQEWQEHYPEVISTTTNDDYDFDVLSLAYTETIPMLLGAIKELKARVEALENA